MTSFDELTERASAFTAEREWGQFHTPKNLAMAICGEAGELAAELQWLDPAEVRQSLSVSDAELRDLLASEAADVLLYLISFARVCGFDLVEAASRKITVNERRYPADLARGSHAKHTQLSNPVVPERTAEPVRNLPKGGG
jgi:dCTP diphosphatase